MKNFTDEKLIQAYLGGDERALEELIRRYLPLIYNFSCRYSGNKENASDIAQEVFVKVWKNLKKFDTAKEFRPWIFAIAKRSALDWLKKKNAVPFSLLNEYREDENFEENIFDPDQISVIDGIYKDSISKNLKLAVLKLPPKYNYVINLHYDKGLNFREISSLLGESINTVKSRYRRGLFLLRKIVSEG